jgi:uncharacterized protein involved in exopolysaccharide biosynthesis
MRVEERHQEVKQRRRAIRSVLNSNRKASNNVTTYLEGYYDALELVEAELRDLKDAEIMGHDVTECEQ